MNESLLEQCQALKRSQVKALLDAEWVRQDQSREVTLARYVPGSPQEPLVRLRRLETVRLQCHSGEDLLEHFLPEEISRMLQAGLAPPVPHSKKFVDYVFGCIAGGGPPGAVPP